MRVVSVVLLLAACSSSEAPPTAALEPEPAPEAPATHATGETLPAGDASEESLFLLESTWTDHHGREVSLSALRGHPALVVMFYGTCHGACPVLVHDLQAIDEAVGAGRRADVRYVLVTFDPERDTESRLAAMAAERSLDERWMFLRGSDDDVRELSAVLGVRYRRGPDGSYSHTNLITLLGIDGTIVARSEGLGRAPTELAARITQL